MKFKIKNILFLFLTTTLSTNSSVGQEITKKSRFSYEINFGTFTSEYLRLNNNFSYYHYVENDLLLGFNAGRSRLSGDYNGIPTLEKKNIFLNTEGQTQFTLAARYYPLDKKFTPLIETRAGINLGDRTVKVSPTFSILVGYAVRFPKGSSINIGYHPQFVQYYSSTYHTNGKGKTVYWIDNYYPIRRISHNAFLNFTF